ncbi:MAG: DUF2945 domain-containing protein [Marinicaulis sp.]|nr:DUF2945 domain-containing protein [Marinicaulis sp.]
MAKSYDVGDKLEWDWGNGSANGKIAAVHEEDITKTIKGSEITSNASAKAPAYTIKQEDGDTVWKSGSQIRSAS